MTILAESPIGVVLRAQDMVRAKQFYRDTLGLPIRMETEDGIQFEAGQGSTLLIYPRPDLPVPENTAASWAVRDLDAAMDEMEAHGVTFEVYDLPHLKTDERGVAELGGSRHAWFKDSEGNALVLSEYG